MMLFDDEDAGIKDDAAHDAQIVLAANGSRRTVEMTVHVIEVHAESESRRKTGFSAAAKHPGRILTVPSAEAAHLIWERSGNSCTAGEEINVRAEQHSRPRM